MSNKKSFSGRAEALLHDRSKSESLSQPSTGLPANPMAHQIPFSVIPSRIEEKEVSESANYKGVAQLCPCERLEEALRRYH
jgi:hypothetical protein